MTSGRIVDDIGGAYMFGIGGGTIFYTFKGARSAPVGSRLHGALTCIQARSPVLGGNFAVWGGLFAACDCSLVALRRKEDPWNSILSGAATGVGITTMLPSKLLTIVQNLLSCHCVNRHCFLILLSK